PPRDVHTFQILPETSHTQLTICAVVLTSCSISCDRHDLQPRGVQSMENISLRREDCDVPHCAVLLSLCNKGSRKYNTGLHFQENLYLRCGGSCPRLLRGQYLGTIRISIFPWLSTHSIDSSVKRNRCRPTLRNGYKKQNDIHSTFIVRGRECGE